MSIREPLYGAAADRVRDQLAGQAPTPGVLPPAITEFLATVLAALDVPLADRPADDKLRAELLTRRAADTRVILELLLTHGDVARSTERLREWTAQHPVTYPTWQARTEQAAAEEQTLLNELAVVMEFPAASGGTVTVTADNAGASPSYGWQCTAGHRDEHPYAALPFARDDAKAHAAACEGRCPAAHPEDPSPCDGPVVVTVLDAGNAGANGCEHHGARLLASLDGGRVYPLPDAPPGAAIRVFKAAAHTAPYAWVKRGERP